MYANWRSAARAHIAEIVAGLPAEANYQATRLALRKGGGSFHCGTSHGKKIWPKECKLYLAQHFTQAPSVASGAHRIRRDDIVFPFREGNHG